MHEILNKLTAKDVKEAYHFYLKESLGHPERMKRVERGYDILMHSTEYTMTITSRKPLTFSVVGPHDTYTIIESDKICTCPDFEIICKHRFAVKIIMYAAKRMRSEGTEVAKKKGKDNA